MCSSTVCWRWPLSEAHPLDLLCLAASSAPFWQADKTTLRDIPNLEFQIYSKSSTVSSTVIKSTVNLIKCKELQLNFDAREMLEG